MSSQTGVSCTVRPGYIGKTAACVPPGETQNSNHYLRFSKFRLRFSAGLQCETMGNAPERLLTGAGSHTR